MKKRNKETATKHKAFPNFPKDKVKKRRKKGV